MIVKPYTPADALRWDDFVAKSRQRCFMFFRGYMDYHADRFTDASVLVYADSGKLVALLPANREGDVVWSHQGLTYGGWITPMSGFDASTMLEVWQVAIEYFKGIGIREIYYKCVPWIYPVVPADDDIYAIFRFGGMMEACGISSAINLGYALAYNENSRRNLKKAESARLSVEESDDYEVFWQLLTEVLQSRHNTAPVHSLDEIRMLKSRFVENIKLFTVCNAQGEVMAGSVVYLTPTVAHLQYIASSAEGRNNGALALLFKNLERKYASEGVRYLDFGISTEHGGKVLNEGLHRQKSGFGARSVAYATYCIALK